MSGEVEFFYDYGSPASYLAWTQLPKIAEAAGAVLVYRPMLLGGVFKATGNQTPAAIPAKGEWMQQDLSRFAARYRVPYERNPYFPIITLQHMRMAVAAQMDGGDALARMDQAMFRAIWVEAKDMNDPDVVAAVLTATGFDAPAMAARCAEPEIKQRLIANTEEAVGRGVFGAPTMFVGDEMFFGQDRLDFVAAALAA